MHEMTLKEAGYRYWRYDRERKLHVLRCEDTGELELWAANKNYAGTKIKFKNTHLEYCRDYELMEDTGPVWEYQGDVNLENGGVYFDVSQVERYGFDDVPFVEVTDLDSACGFRGAVMIEKGDIVYDDAAINKSLNVVGLTREELDAMPPRERLLAAAYAIRAYGLYDVDERRILQLDRNEGLTFDGWTAERDRRSLERIIREDWLS